LTATPRAAGTSGRGTDDDALPEALRALLRLSLARGEMRDLLLAAEALLCAGAAPVVEGLEPLLELEIAARPSVGLAAAPSASLGAIRRHPLLGLTPSAAPPSRAAMLSAGGVEPCAAGALVLAVVAEAAVATVRGVGPWEHRLSSLISEPPPSEIARAVALAAAGGAGGGGGPPTLPLHKPLCLDVSPRGLRLLFQLCTQQAEAVLRLQGGGEGGGDGGGGESGWAGAVGGAHGGGGAGVGVAGGTAGGVGGGPGAGSAASDAAAVFACLALLRLLKVHLHYVSVCRLAVHELVETRVAVNDSVDTRIAHDAQPSPGTAPGAALSRGVEPETAPPRGAAAALAPGAASVALTSVAAPSRAEESRTAGNVDLVGDSGAVRVPGRVADPGAGEAGERQGVCEGSADSMLAAGASEMVATAAGEAGAEAAGGAGSGAETGPTAAPAPASVPPRVSIVALRRALLRLACGGLPFSDSGAGCTLGESVTAEATAVLEVTPSPPVFLTPPPLRYSLLRLACGGLPCSDSGAGCTLGESVTAEATAVLEVTPSPPVFLTHLPSGILHLPALGVFPASTLLVGRKVISPPIRYSLLSSSPPVSQVGRNVLGPPLRYVSPAPPPPISQVGRNVFFPDAAGRQALLLRLVASPGSDPLPRSSLEGEGSRSSLGAEGWRNSMGGEAHSPGAEGMRGSAGGEVLRGGYRAGAPEVDVPRARLRSKAAAGLGVESLQSSLGAEALAAEASPRGSHGAHGLQAEAMPKENTAAVKAGGGATGSVVCDRGPLSSPSSSQMRSVAADWLSARGRSLQGEEGGFALGLGEGLRFGSESGFWVGFDGGWGLEGGMGLGLEVGSGLGSASSRVLAHVLMASFATENNVAGLLLPPADAAADGSAGIQLLERLLDLLEEEVRAVCLCVHGNGRRRRKQMRGGVGRGVGGGPGGEVGWGQGRRDSAAGTVTGFARGRGASGVSVLCGRMGGGGRNGCGGWERVVDRTDAKFGCVGVGRQGFSCWNGCWIFLKKRCVRCVSLCMGGRTGPS
jgi:hypothetical protein